MKIKTLGWLIIPAIAFPSCTEKALDYRSDEGTVTIAPEWSDFACPSSACYRFYTTDGKAVAGGIFSVKGVENNSFIGVIFEIALHHGELIKIGQQSQVHCTHNCLRSFALSDSDGSP